MENRIYRKYISHLFIILFLFRFLNLLASANLKLSILWTHVKAVRSEYKKKHILHDNCEALVPDKERKTNFNSLQQHLKIWNTTDEAKNLSNIIIEEGGKMFIYINSCPNLHWENFYHHILFEKPNSEMILSVLNAMKNSRTRGSKMVANKFLVKLSDVFGFEYNHFVNGSKWVNNIVNVKGIELVDHHLKFSILHYQPKLTLNTFFNA